uniref:Methyltransferase n=1 Tax=Brassica oleracea var. oleracea TaxID=109376 RepID=A0A0D3DX92_BRAOL
MVAGWEVIGDISFLRGRQHILKVLITELRRQKYSHSLSLTIVFSKPPKSCLRISASIPVWMSMTIFALIFFRCSMVSVMAEVDRILIPQGTFIIWRRSDDLCSEVMVASYRGRDHYIGDSK